jgi:hypothetical protein
LGEKPVTPAIVESTLVPDGHDLEPTVTRDGDQVKSVSEGRTIRQVDVRAWLHGPRPPGRTAA